jgi:hypothetical protein
MLQTFCVGRNEPGLAERLHALGPFLAHWSFRWQSVGSFWSFQCARAIARRATAVLPVALRY